MMKNLDVVGLALPNATDEEMTRIHAGIRAGLECGVLKPVIGREMPLDEAAAAHHAVLEPGAFGKIILKP